VEEHDWEELAGFGEDEGYVVDVGEACVAKRRGERGGYGDEDHGPEDGARWEDARVGGIIGGGGEEIDVACQSCEGGLDRV